MTISKYDVQYTKILQQIGITIILTIILIREAVENWDKGLGYVLFHTKHSKDIPMILYVVIIVALLVEATFSLYKIKKSQRKYKKYFESEKNTTIRDLSLELHTDWEVVIKELEHLIGNKVKKADVKNSKYIKFSNNKVFPD